MDWADYQRQAMRTQGATVAQHERLVLGALGLSGEAGEITDFIKKVVFHGHDLDRAILRDELGDLLWYVAYLLETLDLPLDAVLDGNIAKLRARYPDGFSSERSRNRDATP